MDGEGATVYCTTPGVVEQEFLSKKSGCQRRTRRRKVKGGLNKNKLCPSVEIYL